MDLVLLLLQTVLILLVIVAILMAIPFLLMFVFSFAYGNTEPGQPPRRAGELPEPNNGDDEDDDDRG